MTRNEVIKKLVERDLENAYNHSTLDDYIEAVSLHGHRGYINIDDKELADEYFDAFNEDVEITIVV